MAALNTRVQTQKAGSNPVMISFIRNALSSWLVLGLFALILVAFIITGFGSGGGGGLGALGGSGSAIAKIGSTSVSAAEVASRVRSELEGARMETPGLDMAAFDKAGGIDQTIERLINSRIILAYGEKHGLVISERLIDSEIAKTTAFYGPTGKFDRSTYLRVIGNRRLSEPDHRDDVRSGLLADQIIPPAAGAAKAPALVVAPYASLLLETRYGQAGFIASSAYLGAAPSDQEVKDFYTRNLTRYTVPETRVVRYAVFDKSRFAGKVAPTEAEVAAAYKADSDRYGATEKRSLSQVIVQSEAQAKAIASKVASGTALSAAAKEAGVEATTLAAQNKKAFGALASVAVADAVFAAAQGSIAAPAKSGLGWHVVRVDAVERSAGQSLDQARAGIVTALTARKTDEALADMIARIDDRILDGATFDAEVKAEGLTVISSPPVTASGIAPGNPNFKAPPEMAVILKDAFQSDIDDDAAVLTLGDSGAQALYDLETINPSAAKPLAAIREQVISDTRADKALRAARKAATDLVAQVNKGTPLSAALAAAKLPAASAFSAKRLELAEAGEKAPAPLQMLFKIAKGKARMLEAGGGTGYMVVWLEKLEPGNAATRPDMVSSTQAELSRVIGNEYTQQLLDSMKVDLGVTRNPAAIAALRKSLISGTTAQ
jgi:peptidyl-prolyl cis-trans isomerase D